MAFPLANRFESKKSAKGPLQKASVGKRVLEAKRLRGPKKSKRPTLQNRIAEMRMAGRFGKKRFT